MGKENVKKYSIKDWGWPVCYGVITFILSIFAWMEIEKEAINTLLNILIPIVFTYATTLFGLLIASYTILQGYTNEHVEKMKTLVFYPRYKRNLILNLKLLVSLAVASVLGMITKGLLSLWLMKLYLGLSLAVVSFTIVAAFYWVNILIKHFDTPKEDKTKEG